MDSRYGGIAQLGAHIIQLATPHEIGGYPVLKLQTPCGTRGTNMWGYSSAGRALEWHSRGQRFDPAYLHHFTTEYRRGGIAQLGERLNGIQEVSGSIPLISTTTKNSYSQTLYEFLVYVH